MPPPASADELLDLVQKSGVTDGGKLQAYVQKLASASGTPTEPAKMAGMLVRDGLLTHFQAEQLLQGKWKRFSIGKYKVLEKLGAGGMGQVFLCEHKLMRRRVAVKVLPVSKAEDEASLQRFYREAKAIAAVDHPNLVRAYDIDQDDNLHFLVMEYVDGTNFHDLIKKFGPLDITRACHYVYAAAVGLQHAHEMGLVHRDIKPGNILIDRAGVVKILDMGLARFFHDEDDVLTKKYDENVLGTADYLAPEQALDSHTVDIRADIYSLGATFYYLLTASPLFPEGSVAQKLIWHQSREPAPIRSLRADVPDEVVAVVNKMMAKDANRRFQVPADLIAALAPWVATPIGPPPDREMPNLSPAATNAVVGTSMRGPATTTGAARAGSPTIATNAAWASTTPALATTPPPAAPATPPAGGNGVWESLDDETQAVAVADTDRAGNRAAPRPAEPAGRKPGRTGRRGPLIVVAVCAAAVLGAGYALYAHFTKKPAQPDAGGGGPTGAKRLVVGKGEGAFPGLRAALNKAAPGDTIVLREERIPEPTVRFDARMKDITIESDLPGGKAAVIEYAAPVASAGAVGVFSIASAPGLRVKNVEIDAKGAADFGLHVSGVCPGMVFENVTVRGAKAVGVRLDNVSGETGDPLTFDRLRVLVPPNTDGVVFAASGKLESKRVVVRDGRFEGVGGRGRSGVRVEGAASDVELSGNRFFRLDAGVAFARSAGAVRTQVAGSTFYEVGAGFVFDMAGAEQAKFAVGVSRSYFAKTGQLAQRTDGGGPVAGVTFTDNAHDGESKSGNVPFAATKLDAPVLPAPNPDDNATFLRFPGGGPEVGPNKAKVGAN